MRTILAIAIAVGAAAPALAQPGATLTPKQFVAKAGASDKFEITEGQLMQSSSDPHIKMIAEQLVKDHTESTAKVKAAAKASGLTPMPPVLNAKQAKDVAALKRAKGKARDKLYVAQQLPAHQEALTLMQTYSTSGTAPALKTAAGEIAPVVQSHIDMLQKGTM